MPKWNFLTLSSLKIKCLKFLELWNKFFDDILQLDYTWHSISCQSIFMCCSLATSIVYQGRSNMADACVFSSLIKPILARLGFGAWVSRTRFCIMSATASSVLFHYLLGGHMWSYGLIPWVMVGLVASFKYHTSYIIIHSYAKLLQHTSFLLSKSIHTIT